MNNNESAEEQKLEQAIAVATELIDNQILPQNSINSLSNDLIERIRQSVLEADEKVIFIIKQSKLHDLIPEVIVFTNRKIALVYPSVMHFLKVKSMALKSTNMMQYTKLNDISMDRGLKLRTITITVAGMPETEIEGLKLEDAELMLKFVQRVVEYLEG